MNNTENLNLRIYVKPIKGVQINFLDVFYA